MPKFLSGATYLHPVSAKYSQQNECSNYLANVNPFCDALTFTIFFLRLSAAPFDLMPKFLSSHFFEDAVFGDINAYIYIYIYTVYTHDMHYSKLFP